MQLRGFANVKASHDLVYGGMLACMHLQLMLAKAHMSAALARCILCLQALAKAVICAMGQRCLPDTKQAYLVVVLGYKLQENTPQVSLLFWQDATAGRETCVRTAVDGVQL
jgi:hypothetical protein